MNEPTQVLPVKDKPGEAIRLGWATHALPPEGIAATLATLTDRVRGRLHASSSHS